ncbi:unnamed protein product [Symbiodinium sp. CCMP2592]|nr:unnamed protein product [Symbiodinium sp. CCMP2592]
MEASIMACTQRDCPQYVGKRPDAGRTASAWKIMSWNSGGLTTEVFQELRTFAAMGECDIILVQETKCRHDNVWSDKAFHFIRSQGIGLSDKVAGLLVMLSTRIVQAGDIQFHAVHQGQSKTTPEARRAQVIANFPVAAWRDGANHHPVEAFVLAPRAVRRLHPKANDGHVRFNQDALLQDIKKEHPSEALAGLRQMVAQSMTNANDANEVLLQAAARHYPLPPRPAQPPTQPEQLAIFAKHMWAIFRQMTAQRKTARAVFMAWKLWAQFQQAHSIHKQRAKARTKERRDELLTQAQEAARQGNAHGLWRVVKQLAPKAPRKKLQLQRDGRMLSTVEELDWILQAFGTRYGEGEELETVQLHGQAAPEPIANVADLPCILGHLNLRKAVPRGTAPTVLWKACNWQVATSVTDGINLNWMQSPPHIEQHWLDATVFLLPKAHGRMKTPLDLRPIGLQDPLGKRVMTLLLRQARDEIVALVHRFPQTAYIPGRGTSTALRQVFRHCRDIRNWSVGSRLTVHQFAMFSTVEINLEWWQTLAQHIDQYSCPSLVEQLEPVQKGSARSLGSAPYWFYIIRSDKMFADPAMNEFFGEVLQEPTTKRRRPEENKEHRQCGRRIQVLKQDHSFMLLMRPGKDTALTFLYQTATLYKKKQEESPTWGAEFQPLRVVLSLALFRELANRIAAVEADETKTKEAVDLGWMTKDLQWKFQAWNPQLKHLQEDTSRAPLPTVELKRMLEKASFYFDLSCRNRGQEAWEVMSQLQGCCALQLIGLAYKRARLRRGPVAQKLRDLLRER